MSAKTPTAPEIYAEFIAAARDTLAEGMQKITHCVDQLNDDQLWWRSRPEMNSIANLILHLSGNLRQWMISGLGGAKDIRNRPLEFSDRSKRPRGELLAMMEKIVSEADSTLAKLPLDQAVSDRRIQGFQTHVIQAIFITVSHFRGHVQEIIHLSRVQLGERYKFYFVPKGPEQESSH